MTSTIRILDSGVRSPRWNVAMTAALAAVHADGAVPDTVRFHRYACCVLLGRSQQAADAVDLDCCRRHGIEIAHRVTGGGAVYMSPRILAWDVVVDRKRFGGDLTLATRQICEGVAAGLCALGCTARFRPANDIEIGGLKVSGSSGYAEGRSIALQGTILIEDDVAEISRALRIPEAILRGKVTCLATALGEAPSLQSVQSAIVEGLMPVLGCAPCYQDMSAADLAAAEAFLGENTRAIEDAA
jgi:lipoate-protein ligase A